MAITVNYLADYGMNLPGQLWIGNGLSNFILNQRFKLTRFVLAVWTNSEMCIPIARFVRRDYFDALPARWNRCAVLEIFPIAFFATEAETRFVTADYFLRTSHNFIS